jgi:hypothetical protein
MLAAAFLASRSPHALRTCRTDLAEFAALHNAASISKAASRHVLLTKLSLAESGH